MHASSLYNFNPMPSSVSVCIPAYRSRFLAEAIESVLNQTRPADEVLIVDDCSPHKLDRIVSRYEPSEIRYVRNPSNLGVPANYNRALALARSDYVMLFGDHDVMLPTFVERCARVLDENPEASFAFSAASAIDENGEVLTDHPSGLFPSVFSGDRLVRRHSDPDIFAGEYGHIDPRKAPSKSSMSLLTRPTGGTPTCLSGYAWLGGRKWATYLNVWCTEGFVSLNTCCMMSRGGAGWSVNVFARATGISLFPKRMRHHPLPKPSTHYGETPRG